MADRLDPPRGWTADRYEQWLPARWPTPWSSLEGEEHPVVRGGRRCCRTSATGTFRPFQVPVISAVIARTPACTPRPAAPGAGPPAGHLGQRRARLPAFGCSPPPGRSSTTAAAYPASAIRSRQLRLRRRSRDRRARRSGRAHNDRRARRASRAHRAAGPRAVRTATAVAASIMRIMVGLPRRAISCAPVYAAKGAKTLEPGEYWRFSGSPGTPG